jgi:hypothetical protein
VVFGLPDRGADDVVGYLRRLAERLTTWETAGYFQ